MAPVRTYAPPRRRSSVATLAALSSIKSGNYYPTIPAPAPRPVTFAPNVTPTTYLEEADDDDEAAIATLFPPAEGDLSEEGSSSGGKKRAGGSRRRSVGHIPRPPNAFMLFRADFVRMKHVPGSVETTHGSLSKIIGNCWRQLPLEEKRVWEIKAKHAKAEHKARYPGYRFRPVHNKQKRAERAAAAAGKAPMSPAEDRRCEQVAALLLQGKKGHELTEAVRALDEHAPAPAPAHEWAVPQVPAFAAQRRPSSVPPLPTHGLAFQGIALPSVPFFAPLSRPASPARAALGSRRTSSVPPVPTRSWLAPAAAPVPAAPAFAFALPEADTSLFEPGFFELGAGFAAPFLDAFAAPPAGALGPLDALAPHELAGPFAPFDPAAFAFAPAPPSSYGGSPAPSDGAPAVHVSFAPDAAPAPAPEVPVLAAPMPLRAPSFAAFEHEHVLYGAPAPQEFFLGAFGAGFTPAEAKHSPPSGTGTPFFDGAAAPAMPTFDFMQMHEF